MESHEAILSDLNPANIKAIGDAIMKMVRRNDK